MAGGKQLIGEKFGPLNGVRIVSTGRGVAQPFAAELAAESGAEVIHVEHPRSGDPYRESGLKVDATGGKSRAVSANWIQERRNMFCVTLDPAHLRGRPLLLQLLQRAEIWMDNSAPGYYEQIGLGDDAVRRACPRLVITHVSGFGRDGGPDCAGASDDDALAQAFGGMMALVGGPEPEPPVRAQPAIGDYLTALCALWSSLAALVHARAGGEGQSVDVAKYEVVHKHLGPTMIEYFQRGAIARRSGNKSPAVQPYDTYRTADGWLMIVALREQYGRLCRLIGLDPALEKWKHAAWNPGSPEGIEFDTIFRSWMAARSTGEATAELGAIGVPYSPIMSSRDCAEHPHFQARAMHIEWEDGQAGKVKGTGLAPKFSATPGRIWRGSVELGHDNRLIYGELLGLDAADLEDLSRAGVI
jgi:crotonobetainyl-CoA:carnitine CoA-transferase CaiB-like acyl-CoA transferase